jgi:hypothetical protein
MKEARRPEVNKKRIPCPAEKNYKIATRSGSRVLMTKNCKTSKLEKIRFFKNKKIGSILIPSLSSMKSKPQEKPLAPDREHQTCQNMRAAAKSFFYIALIRIHPSLNADPDPAIHLNTHPDPDKNIFEWMRSSRVVRASDSQCQWQLSWFRSQHPPTQWNRRGGR